MRLYQQGDSDAFEVIYGRYSKKIYSYLKQRLPSREETDEVYQAVFLKLHQARSQYDPKFSVLQWLFVISKSVLFDHFRKMKREGELVSQVFDDSDLITFQPEVVTSNDRGGSVLAALSDEQRQVVEWRVLDELSYEQIAQRLDQSQDNVRQTLSRALRRLRINFSSGALSGTDRSDK